MGKCGRREEAMEGRKRRGKIDEAGEEDGPSFRGFVACW